MTGRVLVIEHETICPPGRLGEWLSAAGLELDVVRPYEGDGLPDQLDHDALIVLGGTMGANDDEGSQWLPATKRLLADAVRSGVPTLGVCLGHQLLAVACGGQVQPNPYGVTTGLRAVDPAPSTLGAGDPILDGLPAGAVAIHWNGDVVTVPPLDAVVLAATTDGWPQVLRVGEHAWGVQFHPEADPGIVGVWADLTVEQGALSRSEADARLDEIARADEALTTAWQPWAKRFAELVLSRPAAARR